MKKFDPYLLMLLSLTIFGGLCACSSNDEDEILKPLQHFTITYNINNADNGTTPKAVSEKGGNIISLHNGSGFSRAGFTFGGWNTNANGSGTDYPAGENFTLDGDITLFAKWTKISNSNTLKITIGSNAFTATLVSNATATAFKEFLPMTVNMSEHAENEKFYTLPHSIASNHINPGTIQNGDLMLYSTSTLVLFYKTFSTSYSYTRIAKVDSPSGLQSALGAGNITVTFELQ